MIAVSDVSGGVHDEAGLDIAALHAFAAEHGSLAGYTQADRISNEQLLELPCDVLVLAAREDQVNADNAPLIRAKLIAEGANGPTSVAADAILAERGIPVLPDVLTNAGGVTVSYFEWVQDIGRFFWDRDEIRARLAEKLGDAFERVWALSEERNLTLRERRARRGDPRGRGRPRGPRDLPVTLVREAMVTEPASLEASASAQEAGELLARPEVRAVFVTRDEQLAGVVTRKTLVREVVARGRDPRTTTVGEVAEEPYLALDGELEVEEALGLMEEHDLERVPVVEGGRLVGVLSRAVIQRRLVEDEPLAETEDAGD